MPTYLIVRDFPLGLSVPYILASDGVSFFLFGRTKFVVGNEFCRKAL